MKKWSFPVITAAIGTIISLLFYGDLPLRMAIHFDINSAPDNWVARPLAAFALPVLIVLVSALVVLGAALEKDENKRRRNAAVLPAVLAILSIMLLTVHAFIIAYNLGYAASAAVFAAAIVGIVFILLGNLLPKLPQRTFAWPKLSDADYKKTARLQGRVMMLFGVVFVLLALLPNQAIFPVFLPLLALFVLFIIFSSMRRSGS